MYNMRLDLSKIQHSEIVFSKLEEAINHNGTRIDVVTQPNVDDDKEEEEVNDDSSGLWKCCKNYTSINENVVRFDSKKVQTNRYTCPKNPGNFSFYYGDNDDTRDNSDEHMHIVPGLKPNLWMNKSFFFVGGSTTRQMLEQFQWEFEHQVTPSSIDSEGYDAQSRFVFKLNQGKSGCCKYDASHGLDLRQLNPTLENYLSIREPKPIDFVIINVGTWWDSNTVGTVIDENGIKWKVDTTYDWKVIGLKKTSSNSVGNTTSNNNSSSLSSTGDGFSLQTQHTKVDFASLMERAFKMMNKIKSPQTRLIWRTETKTDCPIGTGYRTPAIIPVLDDTGVGILNISEATCKYASQNLDDSATLGPHLCFPSPVLRYWLQMFQKEFL